MNPSQIARNSGYSEAEIFLEQQLHEFSVLASGNAGTPIHDAIRNNATLGVIKLLLERFPDSISACDANQNCPLHVACHLGKCKVVIYLMKQQTALASKLNGDGKLPFELLLRADSERDEMEYMDAVWHLLVAYPVECSLLARLVFSTGTS